MFKTKIISRFCLFQLCLLLSCTAAFSQDFLNRSYLKSLPGATINPTTTSDQIDSVNKFIYRGAFLEKTVEGEGASSSQTNLDRLRTSRITVLPVWRMNPDSIVSHLEAIKGKNKGPENVKLSGTTEKNSAGTLYSELLSDYTGLWRISLGSAITASSDDEDDDETEEDVASVKDIQNFFVGGGNIIAKGSLPILLIYNTKYRHTRNTGVYLVPKAGVSFPAFGTSSDDPTWNLDLGVEGEVFGGGVNNEIGFYGRVRVAAVWASQDFTKQLLADDRRLFGYGQANVGTLLKEKVYINVNFPISLPINIFGKDDPIDRIPVSVSTGLLFN